MPVALCLKRIVFERRQLSSEMVSLEFISQMVASPLLSNGSRY